MPVETAAAPSPTEAGSPLPAEEPVDPAAPPAEKGAEPEEPVAPAAPPAEKGAEPEEPVAPVAPPAEKGAEPEEPVDPVAPPAEKGAEPESVTPASYPTSGAIGVKYATASAVLGAAISPEFTSQRFGGAYQLFENGTIAYLPQYGAYIVIGGNNSVWQSIGAQDSDLGYPISAEYAPMTGGVMQIFQFGKISWNPATGSRVTKGGIGGAWDNAGGPLGGLGYPTTDEYAPMPGGVMQDFQYGKISWNAATGSRVTKGGIGATWDSAGGPLSGLGYPTTDEYATVNGGAVQNFQYGQIAYSPATGSHIVRGAIGAMWILSGGPRGSFGYPTADEITGLTGGGAKQYFQDAEIVWSPSVGTKRITGGIRSIWVAQGSEAGRLGYPISNAYWVSGGEGQDFQGGRITRYSGNTKIEYASDMQ
ncbi:hypothetical protein AAIH32_09445 [Pseudarthrobacter oxydans]|uniref:hypothetical protein n=1 Tax=Pseudarthrobacter oxydans TaxID=1671 RepID=UPI003D2DCA9C